MDQIFWVLKIREYWNIVSKYTFFENIKQIGEGPEIGEGGDEKLFIFFKWPNKRDRKRLGKLRASGFHMISMLPATFAQTIPI